MYVEGPACHLSVLEDSSNIPHSACAAGVGFLHDHGLLFQSRNRIRHDRYSRKARGRSNKCLQDNVLVIAKWILSNLAWSLLTVHDIGWCSGALAAISWIDCVTAEAGVLEVRSGKTAANLAIAQRRHHVEIRPKMASGRSLDACSRDGHSAACCGGHLLQIADPADGTVGAAFKARRHPRAYHCG